LIHETGGLDAKLIDLLCPENNTPMPATGVKALRFFKRETVIPTSNMLMPVEPNLTAFTEPCSIIGHVHPAKLRELPRNAAD
jgi:hypothetical protein